MDAGSIAKGAPTPRVQRQSPGEWRSIADLALELGTSHVSWDSGSPPLEDAAGGKSDFVRGSSVGPDQHVSPDLGVREGASVGPYRLVERLGAGANASVFRAYRDGSLAPVAVKLFHRPLHGRALDRVWREIGLLESARLAGVPRLLDHGAIEGRPFLVTEFVDGLELDEHCRVHALDRDRRIELLAEVADVVQSIHDAGIAHRDLKPSNVLVDRRGRPVVLDLGTAVAMDQGDARVTLTGSPVGTPAFMAPEQARGERPSSATASDVWSLGAIAWQILLGRAPHEPCASVVALLQRRATEPAQPAGSIAPALPDELGAVLDAAVAMVPGDRHPSAASLAAELRRARRGEAVRRPVPRGVHGHVAGRLAGGVALAALAGVATWLAAGSSFGPSTRAGSAPSRPARGAWVDPAGRYAALLGPAGLVLRELDGGVEGAITCAALLEPRDDPLRRGLFLVGAGADSPLLGSGRLVAFEIDGAGGPRWTAGEVDGDLQPPPWISQVDGRRFAVDLIRVLDVAPQPGKEIVAIHQHRPSSPACIRVYDATARVLSEVWHDGDIDDIRWLPDPGLLVMAGANAEAFWDERGALDVGHAWYPMVLFAIRPEPGRRGFVRTPGGLGSVEPAWYRALLPPMIAAGQRGLGEERTALEAPGRDLDANRCFRLCLTVAHAPPRSLVFVFDEHGRELVALRQPMSSYQSTRGLPDPAAFSWGPLPAIVQRRPGRGAR